MNYIRIYEVLDLTELSLIKLSLNKENIRYRVQHENTLQMSNVYSMGYTGALVEVLDEDVPLAVEVLKEMGINLEEDPEKNRFEILNLADQIIDRIPGLRVVEGSLRYFFFFVPLAMILFLWLVSLLL